jgi:Histone methylation protein DOT1
MALLHDFNIYCILIFIILRANKVPLKIQDFLSSLPQSVIKGEEVSVPDNVVRKMLKIANVNEKDIFYDLGYGNNNTITIAAKEFRVKRSVGIDIRRPTSRSHKRIPKINSKVEIINGDIRTTNISDATVLLFWFTDPEIIDLMTSRVENELKDGARIITIWSPPDLMLPTKTEFPFFVCEKPFKYAKNIQEQIKSIYGNPCIDFTASWLLVEKYLHELEVVPKQYLRFVNILQSMIIWINAWNMEVACEDEIPPPVQTYIGILKTFFNIDLSDMIRRTNNKMSTNTI